MLRVDRDDCAGADMEVQWCCGAEMQRAGDKVMVRFSRDDCAGSE